MNPKYKQCLDDAAKEVGYESFEDVPPHLNFEFIQRAAELYAERFAEWWHSSEWSTCDKGWVSLETRETITTSELRRRWEEEE